MREGHLLPAQPLAAWRFDLPNPRKSHSRKRLHQLRRSTGPVRQNWADFLRQFAQCKKYDFCTASAASAPWFWMRCKYAGIPSIRISLTSAYSN